MEQAAGKTVAAIFADDGEADFREAESSVMQVQVCHGVSSQPCACLYPYQLLHRGNGVCALSDKI